MTIVAIGRPCDSCGATRAKGTTVGLVSAIKGKEDDFPVLARALVDASPASNPKIEWLALGHHGTNYCQIIRTPFGLTNSEMATRHYGTNEEDRLVEVFLNEHLRYIEQVLTYGRPSREKNISTCGGVYHYLGRLPRDDDVVRLRILRDLQFRENVHAPDYDGVKHEWICEISLQAYRG